MALTAAQEAWLAAELGSFDADDAGDRLTRLLNVEAVAVEILRERRAKLLASPLSLSVPGAINLNQAENVKALERRIAELAAIAAPPPQEVGQDSGFAWWDGPRLVGRRLR